jgi:hypothetical protein
MKMGPFLVAAALTAAVGFMSLPSAKQADNSRFKPVNGASANGQAQPSWRRLPETRRHSRSVGPPVRENYADDHCGPQGSSPSQQVQVVQMRASGPQGVEFAVRTLQGSSDVRLKEVAAYIIGEYGKQELAQLLADSLTDPSEQFLRSAVTALQKLVNPQARKMDPKGDGALLPPPESLPPNTAQLCSALQPLLKDRSPLVRAPAAETIGWLRCNASISDLQALMRDPVERVRFRAAHALNLLTGKMGNFINLDDVVWGRPPLITISRARDGGESQQAGPFLRTASFERQGYFSYRGGIPAQFQTVLQIGWKDGDLEFAVECQDERPLDEGADKLTFMLKPQGQSKLYKFDVAPGQGLVRQAIENPDGHEIETQLNAHATVARNTRAWKVHLQVPFRTFGRDHVPAGETWEANVVRTESHLATGWGAEISSWAYFDRDFPGPPRLGNLYFADDAPVVGIRPAPDNVYAFPFDLDSLPGDQTRPLRPAEEILWGEIVSPNQFVRGMNTFFISQKLGSAGQPPLQLTVVASDYEDGKVIISQVSNLPRQNVRAQRIEFKLPDSIRSRAVDLEIAVSDVDAPHSLFRTRFICVPVVSPPKSVTSYHISKVEEDEKGLWKAGPVSPPNWAIQDYGPMLMSESYPMALVEGQNGTLYGGTYPGGRLFNFNPAAGIVEDLGSPSPPANHLYDLVAAPDGRLYGDLYRPRGRIFEYDSMTHTSADWGVPVPGAFSGECRVTTWAGGRAYGTQRGHLFFAESATGKVIDKGSFFLKGSRYLPIRIASDIQGNLLGIAGGRLFHYLPGSDEVRISDVDLDGWLLPGPQGKLYALFQDGRLFRWEPDKDELVQVTRYAPLPLDEGPHDPRYRFRGLLLVLTGTGELVVARSGMNNPKQTALYVYSPGGFQPINLGNPVAGSLYLTALTLGTRNIVYGLSTQTVYGLERTPVHLYSLARIDRKTD